MEIWKDIQCYEGYYQVSNLGRVKSLPKSWIGGGGALCGHNGKMLKNQLMSGGYEFVQLSKYSKVKAKSVHRLVANAFLDNAENKKTVNHINGIKTDNRVENLEWATYKENEMHAWDLGLKQTSKVRIESISTIVLDTQTGVFYDSIKEAAFVAGMHAVSLSSRLRGIIKNNTNLIYA